MRKRFLCTLLAAVLLLSTVAMASPTARAQSDLHTSQTLVELLVAFEGFTGKCIVDNTQRSVGYGTRCDVCDPSMEGYLDPNRVCAAYTAANPITEEHALELKMKFLAYFETLLNNFAANNGLTFTQNQFDALISLTYNCGQGWMLETEGILRDAVVSGDMGDYLVYAFGLYSKSGKTVSLGHVRRRMIEAEVYLHGNYENDWPDNLRYVFLDPNGGDIRYYYQTFDAAEVCPIRAEFTAVPKGEDGQDLTFAGWFTQPQGGKKVENLTAVLTNGMVLYAQWKNASGEMVTVDKDTSTSVDVTVVMPQWWPNTLYEGPGKYYSEVRKTTYNEQLHITKIVLGEDGSYWGYCDDGWVPLADTNYSSVAVDPSVDGTWYQFAATGVNVRTGPDSSYDAAGVQKNAGDQICVVETQENAEDDQTWAKMTDGYWVCVRNGETVYASVMDPQPEASEVTSGSSQVTGVTVAELSITAVPAVREYPVGGLDVLPDLTGGEITIRYSNNITKILPITRHMVSGFDNSELGTIAIAVTCGGKTATYDVEIVPKIITGIAVQSKPAKLDYQMQKENLDLTGATLLVSYEKDVTRVISITADMVTGFDNSAAGTKTLTVTYEGFTTTFDVNIVDRVVTFLNYDGTVLSQAQYDLGAAVTPPADPKRPDDENGEYVFAGWDKPVVACEGSAAYTAVYTLCHTITFVNYDGTVLSAEKYAPGAAVKAPADPVKPADAIGEYVFAGWDKEVVSCAGKTTYTATYKLRYAPGDMDRNDKLDENDAIYLLWHVFFPQEYPIYARADFDNNGKVDENDAIYLLWHVFFPQEYPLS